MAGADIVKHNDHVYFTFGRFQPPTTGHQLVINKIQELAKGADMYVFASSSQNDIKALSKRKNFGRLTSKNTYTTIKLNENPLSIEQKVTILERMYPGLSIINTTRLGCRDPYKAVAKLEEAGYAKENIHMVVGGDRVEAFKGIGVDVISAGDRAQNPMSGTKMRQAAVNGDFETFKAGIMVGDITEDDAKDIMTQVRTGLGFVGGGKIRRKALNKGRHVSKRRRHYQGARHRYTRIQVSARPFSATRGSGHQTS
jgi:hypothetical protein